VGILGNTKDKENALKKVYPDDNVTVVNVSELPKVAATDVELGHWLKDVTANRTGSLGYCATIGNKNYIVTAGHVAFDDGNTVKYGTPSTSYLLGEVIYSSYGGYADAALVEITGNYDVSNETTYGTTITSVHHDCLLNGSSVAFYGQSSGRNSGVIESTSANVFFGGTEPHWAYDLVATSATIAGGDSGGPILRYSQLQGISKGYDADYSYYTKYKRIQQFFSHTSVLN